MNEEKRDEYYTVVIEDDDHVRVRSRDGLSELYDAPGLVALLRKLAPS